MTLAHVFAGHSRNGDVCTEARRAGFGEVLAYESTEGRNCLQEPHKSDLRSRARRGEIDRLIGGPPCLTYSPALVASRKHLRTRERWWGIKGLPPEWQAEVDQSNEEGSFMAELCGLVWEGGGEFICEQPADLGDPESPVYRAGRAKTAHLFITDPFLELRERVPCVVVTFPQCGMNAPWQKLTALLCSARIGLRLMWLQERFLVPPHGCVHRKHAARAFGRDRSGRRRSAMAAAWTPELCRAMVQAAAAMDAESGLEAGAVCMPCAKGGRVVDGPRMHPMVAAACEEARSRPARFIDLRSLTAASWAELDAAPMQAMPLPVPPLPLEARVPVLADGSSDSSSGSSSSSDPADAVLPPKPWRIEQVPKPKHWERVSRYLVQAESTMQAWFRGDPCPAPRDCVVTQRQTRRCFRGMRLDFRSGEGHVLEPSTRDTVFPGGGQLDRAAFRATAVKHGFDKFDPDILSQCGEGGVESRSFRRNPLTTVLRLHHPGVRENIEVAKAGYAKALAAEHAAFVAGQIPFWPLNCLPRDVAWADRYRMEEGKLAMYRKPRLTIDPTCGADSLNDGIAHEDRHIPMPFLTSFSRSCAVVQSAARRARLSAEPYSADVLNAFPHLVLQRLEWPDHCTLMLFERPDGSLGLEVVWHPRMEFGGAYAPQRWGRALAVIDAEADERVAAFDAANPYPGLVLEWVAGRRRLVSTGALPCASQQVEPRFAQRFVDDLAGVGTSDLVPFPPDRGRAPELRNLDVGEQATRDMGGVPAHPRSRAAMHLRIRLQTWYDHGIADEPSKRTCGDPIVSLGARVAIREWCVNTPVLKAAAVLSQIAGQRGLLAKAAPLPSREVAALVGRLGSISEHEPTMLSVLHGGFSLVAAALRRRYGASQRGFTLRELRLRQGGRAERDYARLLDLAHKLLSTNAGVPLAAQAAFPPIGSPGVELSFTDASFAPVDDGFGGFTFLPGSPGEVWLVSVPWPAWAKAALANNARTRAEKAADPRTELSLPAAELFAAVVIPCLVAAATDFHVQGVCAVGDCDPAVAALNGGTSPKAPLRTVLLAARRLTTRWLGVSVPRDFNLDADRLSHPSQLAAVVADVEAAEWTAHVLPMEDTHPMWDCLREAICVSLA